MRLALGIVTLGLIASSWAVAGPALASGGVFQPAQGTAQPTEHRIVLALSSSQTSLWDEMLYSGNPADFAWVMPIRGSAQVALSSDAVFSRVSALAATQAQSPFVLCACGSSSGTGCPLQSQFETVTTTFANQALVGPYETLQTPVGDAQGLRTWLTTHGYAIPATVDPTLDAIAADGYGFLAMRLQPGVGVSAMRPVRVTVTGSQPVVPLRMLAAGAPDVTPVSLFIAAGERYEPANMPGLTVDPNALVWDYTTGTADYTAALDAAFTAQPNGWVTEFASSFLTSDFDGIKTASALYAGTPAEAQAAAAADYAALINPQPAGYVRITRLTARLPRASLGADLQVQKSADQSELRYVQSKTSTGPKPMCPPDVGPSGTQASGSATGLGAGGPSGAGPGAGGAGGASSNTSSCQASSGDIFSGGPIAFSLALGALALARLRRRQRSVA